MRLLLDVPQVESKIEAGEICLTTASQVQNFLKLEEKGQKAYSAEQKLELLETCSGKSTREVERELATRNPQSVKREVVRAVNESQSRMNLSVENELIGKLDKIKGLLSHVNPNMNYEQLLEAMAEIALDKLDPVRKAKKAEKKKEGRQSKMAGASKAQIPLHAHEVEFVRAIESNSEKRSRYIRATSRHKTWLKNSSQGCEFVDSKTGKRCGSKHFLQIDHRYPFSKGGSNNSSNLRILCGQHNRRVFQTDWSD
jgi:5-methylcytosine-specific restriction endonuclease McrA